MAASSDAVNRSRYSLDPPGYRAASVASSKGSVRPKSTAKSSPV